MPSLRQAQEGQANLVDLLVDGFGFLPSTLSYDACGEFYAALKLCGVKEASLCLDRAAANRCERPG
jgi:hypothetical protein